MRHRRFFQVLGLVLMLCVGTSLFAQRTAQESTAKKSVKAGAVEKPRPSYSIFKDTIVDMSWPEIKKAAEANALVIIPIGVIEEHGPHMGLGADTYQAHLMSQMLKTKLAPAEIKAVVLPPIYWGVMQPEESGNYPGSLRVRPETLKALLMDVFTDVKNWGFKNVFLAALHGDRVHRRTVDEAIAEAEKTLGIDIFHFRDDGNGKRRPEIKAYSVEKPYQPDFHAGAVETAIMNTYFPGEVNTELAKTLKPENTFQPLGYVGDPAGYVNVNAKAYEAMVDFWQENVVAWLKAKPTAETAAGK